VEGKVPQSFIVIAEALSERYGWTPDQIRQLRLEDVNAYIEIISIKQRLQKAYGART
jgi:hypothetical protein